MGCLFAAFAFILKIFKTAVKAVWFVLKLLLFKCRLIFVALFAAAVGLIVWLWPAADLLGANIAWFYVGLAAALVLTIASIVYGVVKKERKSQRRR